MHPDQQQQYTVFVVRVFSCASAGWRAQADALHAADRQELLRRVHNLERHMRENKLRFTFTDALGRAQSDATDQATPSAVACCLLPQTHINRWEMFDFALETLPCGHLW